MAHYASDCWDAEIEISYGWIECVGISDRGDHDLRAHSEISGIPLVACEKFAEPKEVEKLVIRPNKKELGPAFKHYHTFVVEALKAMTEKEAMKMKDAFESSEEIEFKVCKQKTVTLNRNMVTIIQEKTMESARFFYPHVIEPSFGIGRILFCLYEHCFYIRPNKKGDTHLNVFRFPPIVAPIKCAIFPLVKNQLLEDDVARITESLKKERVYPGQHHIAVTVSGTCVKIRERDNRDLISVNVDEAAVIVKKLCKGETTWAEVFKKHDPARIDGTSKAEKDAMADELCVSVSSTES